MHHSESRRIWMEDDTESDVDADIPVEFDGMPDQPVESKGVTFEDVEREIASIPSDLVARTPPPPIRHAILPPPLPTQQPAAVAAAAEEEAPRSTLTPPSTRDLATVTTDDTFSFPPPTIQSVAPVSFESLSERPAIPSRPKAGFVVAATGLMAVIIVLMFASWGSLTAPNTKAWSENWKPPAPAAPAAAPIPEPERPHYFSLDPVEVFTPATPTPPTTTTAARGAARTLSNEGKELASRRTMRTNARLALDDVLQPARVTCHEEGVAPIAARVTATFGPDGHVIDVAVDVPSAASSIGGCLAVAARRARIDAFEGEPLQVTRSIKVQ